MGQVVVDGEGVDLAVQRQDDAVLQLVERDVALEGELFVGRGVAIEQPLDDAVADDAGLDDRLDVARLETRIEDALGAHDDDGALFAEAVAAGLDDLDGLRQAALGELVDDRLAQRHAPGGVTGRTRADADLGLVVGGDVGGGVGDLGQRLLDALLARCGGHHATSALRSLRTSLRAALGVTRPWVSSSPMRTTGARAQAPTQLTVCRVNSMSGVVSPTAISSS